METAFEEKAKSDAYYIGYIAAIADMAQMLWQTGYNLAAAEVLSNAYDHGDVYELVESVDKYEEPFRQFVFETYE